jgi:hypothetical protein
MTTAPSKGFVIFQATEGYARFAELASVSDNENGIKWYVRHGLVSQEMY